MAPPVNQCWGKACIFVDESLPFSWPRSCCGIPRGGQDPNTRSRQGKDRRLGDVLLTTRSAIRTVAVFFMGSKRADSIFWTHFSAHAVKRHFFQGLLLTIELDVALITASDCQCPESKIPSFFSMELVILV